LSHNYVTGIMQDPEGFIWFATLDGLNRFDGYDFTVTWPPAAGDNPGQVFSSNSALLDRSGVMWLDGPDGLNRFDRSSNSLVTFHGLFTVDADSSGPPTIQSIHESRDGMLWIATNNGLTRFDPTNYSAVEYLYDPANPGGLGGSRVGPIHEDHAGAIWLGVYLGGLDKFDPVTETFTHFRHDPNDRYSLSSVGVSYIYEDRSGSLWIGTWNGLNRFDRASGRFEPFQHDSAEPRSLSSNNVTYIHEDSAGALWIGTHTGLNRFDSATQTFERFQHNPDDPYSLSSNRVTSIFEDRAGFLWVATAGTGLNRFNPKNENFLLYNHDETDPDSLDANSVQSIYQDRQGGVWIGTAGGLNRFDRATGTSVHYQHNPGDSPGSLRNNVLSIFEDRSGVLWIGTRSGLSWFDRQNQLLKSFEPDPPMSAFEVHAIFEDDVGRFWLGTSRGLVEFDREHGRFINIGVDPTAPADQVLGAVWVFFIYKDRQEALWLGTDNGLTRYDPEPVVAAATAFSPAATDFTGSFEHFVRASGSSLSDNSSPSDNNFFSVHEDPDGVLWLGTRAGLNKFDPANNTFTAYRKEHGLPGDRVYGILGDDQGLLWISTDEGLASFDPETETFASFSVSDGLQGNAFTLGAYHRNSNGEMYFGGVNGLTVFDPGRLTDPLPADSPPPIVLTDFLLSNRSVPLRSDEAGSPLVNNISHTDELVLTHADTMFAFGFAALSYDSPQQNQYAYRLDGLNKDWVYTDADQRIATYSGLGPGDYLFRVKGSNKYRVWNEAGASIRVTILPPFWQAWWAYATYAIAFSLALFAFVKVRTRALSHRAEQLEVAVNERTEQIRQQKQLIEHQADHLKELLEVKEKLVTNISHEFRTPLTLILGPIEQMLNSAIDGGIKPQLQMAKRNGQRLLRLVDQLLGLSRLGAEQPLTRSAQPLTSLAQAITESFQPLASDKG
ncbi:MAG: two-component regulator propeller domain-containing protein, partial [Gammaproteobacteria bacterium]